MKDLGHLEASFFDKYIELSRPIGFPTQRTIASVDVSLVLAERLSHVI